MKRTVKSELRDIFATNVRKARAKLRWSQEKLAFEAGVNRTYLSAVERSEQNISLDNVEKISNALRLPAAELLTKLPHGSPDGL